VYKGPVTTFSHKARAPWAFFKFDSPLVRWVCVLAPGLVLYFVPLGELTPNQRHLLAIFAATILALVVRPAPMGVSLLLAVTLIAVTGTLPLSRALSGFSSPTVWLIFSAFLFAQAVTHTHLGIRIAYFFISRLAHNSLTLGYAVAASNLVLAPVVPSDTARGGIVAPILRNVAEVLGSEPGPTSARIGSYLTLVGFHTNYLASVMFLTSMVGNPLIAKFASDIAHVDLSWAHWAFAACLPGLCSFAFTPWLLYNLNPPELRETAHAQAFANGKLAALGPMTRQERTLLLILAAVIIGWITSPWHDLGNTTVAMAGVCVILLSGVLTWANILNNAKAWEVLIWFAPLLMMADELSKQGVIRAIFDAGFSHLQGWPWALSLAALALCYFYAHYGFASLTAHISALYPGFLGAALAVGVPASLAAWTLAFLSTLNAGLTHYGTGSAPVYFAGAYVSQNTWWAVGFVVSIVNLAIWLGLGPLWWSFIGLW
jgi:DASS family divalent anion:Na+ symporter